MKFLDQAVPSNVGRVKSQRNLRLRILPSSIFFAIAALLVLVAVTWHLAAKDGNLAIVLPNQLLLSYLPTAVLTILVAAWRQLDYRSKSAAPWQELRQTLTTPERSVLADYVSPFQAVALWQSFKNRHWSVVLTILGFVSLKAATVASTGLLILGITQVSNVRDLVIDSVIDTGSFNASAFPGSQDQKIAYTAYGTITAGLSFPFGTNADFVYDTIAMSDLHDNSSIEAVIDATFPEYECQAADVDISFAPENTTDQNPDHKLKILAPKCSTEPGAIYALNPKNFVCPDRQLSGTSYNVECPALNTDGTGTSWQLLTLTDIRYSQQYNKSQTIGPSRQVVADSWLMVIENLTSILCRPRYRRGQINISIDSVDFPQNRNMTIKAANMSPLQSFSNDDLGTLVSNGLSASPNLFGKLVDNAYAEEYPNTLFGIMAGTRNGSYSSLFGASNMADAANATFKSLAVQALHSTYRIPSSRLTPTYVRSPSNVVNVSTTSLIIILVALALALIMLCVLCLSTSVPASLTARLSLHQISEITRLSPTLHQLFSGSHALSEEGLRNNLSHYMFLLSPAMNNDAETLLAQPHKEATAARQSNGEGSKRDEDVIWWDPLTTRSWYLSLTFAYAVLVIAMLEFLQWLSTKNQGLGNIPAGKDLLRSVYAHYLPAAAMLGLSTLFNCVEFNALVLSPFSRLTSSVPLSELKHRSLLGQTPLLSITSSIRRKHIGAVGAAVAALIGSVLTVVVASLYTVQPITQTLNLTLTSASVTGFEWNNSVADDRGAAILMSLTENLGLSFPRNTWENLTLPSVDQAPELSPFKPFPPDTLVQVHTTAYQADLRCEALPTTSYNFTANTTPIVSSAFFNVSFPLPADCRKGGPNGTSDTLNFVYTINYPQSQSSTYIGKQLDLHVGPYDPIFGDSASETLPANNPDNPPGCPSLAFLYGFVDPKSNDPTAQLEVQVCYQEILAIPVTVILSGASLNISSVSSIQNGTNPAPVTVSVNGTETQDTSFQYRFQTHFESSFAMLNNTENPFTPQNGGSEPAVDNFFQGVIFGRNRIPLTTMRLQSDDDRAVVYQGLRSFYSRYMAQAMLLNMRLNTTQLTRAQRLQRQDELEVPSTIVRGVTQLRIIQNNLPKLILQVMIACMIVGGLFAVSTIPFQKILPAAANPCTLWGQMSLWAGSEYCKDTSLLDDDFITVKTPLIGAVREITFNDNEDERRSDSRASFQLKWWDEKWIGAQFDSRRYGIDTIT